MSLAEKSQQLASSSSGVPRLGLPSYEWLSRPYHGDTIFDSEVPGATSFPSVILLAASFDEILWKEIATVISTEKRALFNLGRVGLSHWGPKINIARDPRWGRILETPGEDPFVAGTFASNFVRGLQDVEGANNKKVTDLYSRPLKISASCTHYLAYDIENGAGTNTYTFNAEVNDQELMETFVKPFEMCVKDGDVSSVMCAYITVNGIPMCANEKLLKETVKESWNLHGYVVSDCDALQQIYYSQHYFNSTPEDVVNLALQAGVDLNCGNVYINHSMDAVKNGKVKEEDIDESLINLYVVLMRLGYFDGNSLFSWMGEKDICSNEHMELARRAAREAIVLLKNEMSTLPLDPTKVKTLALLGPHANATRFMTDSDKGIPCRHTTPVEAFSEYGTVNYQSGCIDASCATQNTDLFSSAIKAAEEADATIFVAGLDTSVESDFKDRKDLVLPGYQTDLINQIAERAKGPVILVLMCGGGIDISFAKNSSKIGAVLWAGYPGQEGGAAIADVVFGKYNPSGRLPVTWYESNYVDKIPMQSMQLRPVNSLGYPGRTYRFFTGTTVYPFGHGLSYTKFSYTLLPSTRLVDVKLDKFQNCHDLDYKSNTYKPECPSVLLNELNCNQYFEFDIQIQNNGRFSGNEIIIIYSKPPQGILGAHIKKVIGFKKVFIEAWKSQTIKFWFNICNLSIVSNTASDVLPHGVHTIIVGEELLSFSFNIMFEKLLFG